MIMMTKVSRPRGLGTRGVIFTNKRRIPGSLSLSSSGKKESERKSRGWIDRIHTFLGQRASHWPTAHHAIFDHFMCNTLYLLLEVMIAPTQTPVRPSEAGSPASTSDHPALHTACCENTSLALFFEPRCRSEVAHLQLRSLEMPD